MHAAHLQGTRPGWTLMYSPSWTRSVTLTARGVVIKALPFRKTSNTLILECFVGAANSSVGQHAVVLHSEETTQLHERGEDPSHVSAHCPCAYNQGLLTGLPGFQGGGGG
eukprot:4256184-Amphidinium_carterae.1